MTSINAISKLDFSALTAKQFSLALDVERVRSDFPILSTDIYGKRLIYLDNGASAQKPRQVTDAVREAYETYYSNVHRGAHYLSQRSTDAFEEARSTIQRFINAPSDKNIIFTQNVTAAINLVAASWGRKFLKAGDEVLITEMEHHANIVPWHMLREELGISLKVVPITDDGLFRLDDYELALGPATKLVAITECSNVLGTKIPIKRVVELAHARNIPVLVDGAQGIVHQPVDVQDLDCDFYAFTGHKLYGPSGIGVLYGRSELLEAMPPYQGGGDMIEHVSFDGVTYAEPPYRFEAGTPPIVQAIGLGAAVRYVDRLGMDRIHAHEQALLAYANTRLAEIEGFRFIGTAPEKAAIISFLIDGLHPFDVAAVLDRQGVAVRVGQHCAEPLMDRLGIEGTVRASFGLYNCFDEIDKLAAALEKAKELLT
ncbi:MAG: cysteine desulfurase [Rhodospirillaceae bacterium TMED8]|nr:cysteine desulfurase [Magnetovibrio sp.]OUT51428.1 MAG: cysteine desulfurase [Rhodospirillaceae bacterium TMED8]|tara:strand:+ start:5374 stop:6657 length:1284 start_codon:yes stop_codon:yes gene_type:complete